MGQYRFFHPWPVFQTTRPSSWRPPSPVWTPRWAWAHPPRWGRGPAPRASSRRPSSSSTSSSCPLSWSDRLAVKSSFTQVGPLNEDWRGHDNCDKPSGSACLDVLKMYLVRTSKKTSCVFVFTVTYERIDGSRSGSCCLDKFKYVQYAHYKWKLVQYAHYKWSEVFCDWFGLLRIRSDAEHRK